MGRDELGARRAELSERVVGPLVLGGPLRPVRPFGVGMALSLGAGRIEDPDLRGRIDVARVRAARLVAVVDTLAELDDEEWALAAALNDLVQVTNPALSGPLTRARHMKLLGSVRALADRVRPPRDLGTALARHATFGRALSVVRTDSDVSWWTGTANFRGQPPPSRLMLWRGLRGVRVETRSVPLSSMCEGVPGVGAADFNDALAAWLTRTPLTDIATAGRGAPRFAWSSTSLSLVSTLGGRTLAFRAVARQRWHLTVAALRLAAQDIRPEHAGPRAIALDFVDEVERGLAQAAG